MNKVLLVTILFALLLSSNMADAEYRRRGDGGKVCPEDLKDMTMEEQQELKQKLDDFFNRNE
uniref:Uncharacterized protein n=1 Tax=Ciona savignyi TaxID=51511 RepID=H2ZFJ3_CIOSA